MSKQLDDIDRRIIAVIQEKGKIPLQELADACHSTPPTCWRRLNTLEEEGYITGYQGNIDRRKIGLDICAFVNFSIESQYKSSVKEIEEKILGCEEIQECYRMTGDADFTLRIVAKSVDEYDKFVQKFLFSLPGVTHIRTSIALKEIKQTTKFPIY